MNLKIRWMTVLALVLATTFNVSLAQDQNQDQELRVGLASWMLKKFPMEEAAARFEENHPGVDVKLITLASEFTTSFIPAMKVGQSPYDVLMPYSGGEAAPFVELDLLAPWDNAFNNPDFMVNGHELSKSDFVPGFFQQAEVDGHVVSLPVFGEVMALTVRKDLLKEAGISDVPSTWSEVAEACVKLEQPFVAGFSTELSRGYETMTSLFGIAKAMGGSVVNDEGHFNLLGPKTVEAMNFLVGLNTEQECAQADATNQWDASRTAYLGGHVAQFYNWAAWGMQALLPKPIFGEDAIVIAPQPGAVENGSVVYIGGIIVPKDGNVRLAQQFVVEMLESKWFQQWSAENYGKSPVLIENYEGLSESPWNTLLKVSNNAAAMPSYLNFAEISNTFEKHFKRAWNGEVTPKEALEAAAREIAPLYQE